MNQVGYPKDAAKRAYLMASGDEAGATFAVTAAGGATIFSHSIGNDLGSWSTAYPHVYALDFTSVSAAGTYSIVVNGPIDATSPDFRIADGAGLYSQALSNSLAFYQAERDGPDYVPSALRTAPGHLNDRNAMTYLTPHASASGTFSGDLTALGKRIDASGGWWDAGDYLKFVQTSSYTVDMLLLGIRDLPNQMGTGSATSDFTAEGLFGVKWLRRMWNDRTKTLYYQVGIGEGNSKTVGDHDIWRLPQADDTYGGKQLQFRYIRHRPAFRAGPPGSPVSPNLAGRDAAAFAPLLPGVPHEPPGLRPGVPALGRAHLRPGRHRAAGKAHHGHPVRLLPRERVARRHGARSDRAVLGARRPGPRRRTPAPARLLLPPPGRPLGQRLHDRTRRRGRHAEPVRVSGIAHFELFRGIARAGSPKGLQTSKMALLADMKKEIDGAIAQARTDPFGFGFGWDRWDSTSHGAGLSVMASEYDQLTHSDTYARCSGRWLANILGANAWGTSLIVGDGTTFPSCMQHQVANIVGSLDGSPPVLAGAVVEGPNSFAATGYVTHMRNCPQRGGDPFAQFNGKTAVYQDNVQSYDTVEPAIDLSASSPLAFARQAAGLF